jgi:hypothetical protein
MKGYSIGHAKQRQGFDRPAFRQLPAQQDSSRMGVLHHSDRHHRRRVQLGRLGDGRLVASLVCDCGRYGSGRTRHRHLRPAFQCGTGRSNETDRTKGHPRQLQEAAVHRSRRLGHHAGPDLRRQPRLRGLQHCPGRLTLSSRSLNTLSSGRVLHLPNRRMTL